MLLAQETARDADLEIELYGKAVKAGERALGRAAFDEDVGSFWGILETRPYMRARCGFAVALRRKGDRDAAIFHFRDMLRLNPNDNQGMRYALLASLMRSRRHDEAEALFREYNNDGAAQWDYGRALIRSGKPVGRGVSRWRSNLRPESRKGSCFRNSGGIPSLLDRLT